LSNGIWITGNQIQILMNKIAMSTKKPIDFVVPWVDGKDPSWRNELLKYKQDERDVDDHPTHYRDWDIFRYWFRSVEKYAPWFHKIFLITYGHIPVWLNTANDRLEIIKHDQYIPNACLPVFSSRPIENNIFRIKGLSEQFVYFNDDMFLSKPVKKTDFFKNNLPCEMAVLNANSGGEGSCIVMNDLSLINKEFIKNDVLRNNVFKWFNLKYGFMIIKTILLLPWKKITGFFTPHQPSPYLKETLRKAWDIFPEELEKTNFNRFRTRHDVNQYLFKYLQIVQGNFYPKNRKGYFFDIKKNSLESLAEAFTSRKYHSICINDTIENDEDFRNIADKVLEILDKAFPEKSDFEI